MNGDCVDDHDFEWKETALLEMIAVSAVKSSTQTLSHTDILFRDKSKMHDKGHNIFL